MRIDSFRIVGKDLPSSIRKIPGGLGSSDPTPVDTIDDLHVQLSSLDDLPCIMAFGVIPMVSVHESDSNLHTYGSYLTLPLSLYLSGLLHPRALVVTVDWI